MQANGLDERYNQTLQGTLVKFTHRKKEVWDEFIDTCVYAYNTSVHESIITFTPFELMFGRRAVLPIDLEVDDRDPDDILQQQHTYQVTDLEQITSHRQELLEAAQANIKRAQDKQKDQYNKKHASPNAFVVGEKVLKKDFRRKKRAGGKMDTRYMGPYLIIRSLGKGFYKLQGVADPCDIVTKVSGAHLKPYRDSAEEHVCLIG